MKYTAEKLLDLFDKEFTRLKQRDLQDIIRGNRNPIAYRTKTIRAGKQIEVEIYPIWPTAPEIPGEPISRKSPDAIMRANASNARKYFERKCNANFTDRDYRMDLTYMNNYLPEDREAQRDVRNYLRRVQYACRKQGMPPPKYMGVSEGRREGSKQIRVHHHLFISCGLPRDELENIWGKGRARSDRLQADRFGYTALAKYIQKDPQGAKRYFCSRNLKEPIITIADTKMSKRRAEQIADDLENNAPAIFAKLYSDCEYLDCTVRRSEFVSGVYIYARMRKDDHKNERHNTGAKRKRRADAPVPMGENAERLLPGTESAIPHSKRRKP